MNGTKYMILIVSSIFVAALLTSCSDETGTNDDADTTVQRDTSDDADTTAPPDTSAHADTTVQPDTGASGCVQDHDGHQACRDELGEMHYCGNDGECMQASGCEAEDCCLPGAQGDAACATVFREDSVCVPGETDGFCSPI